MCISMMQSLNYIYWIEKNEYTKKDKEISFIP